jgi:hypothetical protein
LHVFDDISAAAAASADSPGSGSVFSSLFLLIVKALASPLRGASAIDIVLGSVVVMVGEEKRGREFKATISSHVPSKEHYQPQNAGHSKTEAQALNIVMGVKQI